MKTVTNRISLYMAVILVIILVFEVFYIVEKPKIVKPHSYEWSFDAERSSLGWVATHGFSAFQPTEEGLTATVVGFDPYLHSPDVDVIAEKQFKVIVLIRIVGNASMLKLYWVSDQSPNWNEEKTSSVFVKTDGDWHEYVFDMSEHPHWRGVITKLRLDLEPPDCYGTKISVRYIKVPVLGAMIRVRGPYFSTPIPTVNREFDVRLRVSNIGGEVLNLELKLSADLNLQVLGKNSVRIRLAPREERDINWSLIATYTGLHKIEIELDAPSNMTENSIYIIRFPVFPEIKVENKIFEEVPEGIVSLSDGSFAIKARSTLIRFLKSSIGYGPIIALINETKICGVFGCFARLILANERGLREMSLITPNKVDFHVNENSITFVYEDEKWLFSSTWRIENQSVKVKNQIEALEDISVIQFSVAFYPGELSFASSKDEALLPGLEWLVDDEASSNTLDVEKPYNFRNAPNPLKITIPVMALRVSSTVIGILWDPYSVWDEEGHYPQSLQFASPNWIEGQNNHLFMIFVPTVPEWTKENDDEAYRPYCLKNGKHLYLNFNIYLGISSTVLDAVLEWIRAFGLPKPDMPRTLNEELKLSMRAYLESLWVPQQGWSHASGWTPKPYPGYALLLWLTSLIEDDPSLRYELVGRFNESIKLALDMKGPSYLASGEGCHIPGWQLPFYEGYLEEGLSNIGNYINSLILSQDVDGEWGFQPNERTKILGRVGSKEVGLTATYAAEILRWARITGDVKALSSGLKSLEAMKRYIVPRGAQTWEIPIHAPDILASAKALEAYLEAYIFTGEREYLEKARYWAYTGLPFIYLWSVPDRYVMSYASIPVFGATFYTWPWFGRPVQWCGLVYAYQLLRLSKYDGSFSWRVIGEGILSSGMRQQITSGSLAGTFPDSWDLIANTANGPYINPEDLVKPTLFLMGFDPDLNTLVLKGRSNYIVITTPANILHASFEDETETLRIELSYLKGQKLHVLISGFKAKTVVKSVEFGLKNLAKIEKLEGLNEGWKNALNKFVIVKVVFDGEEITLILQGEK
jgi:hypothetical protein